MATQARTAKVIIYRLKMALAEVRNCEIFMMYISVGDKTAKLKETSHGRTVKISKGTLMNSRKLQVL